MPNVGKREQLFEGVLGESVFWRPFASVLLDKDTGNLLEKVEGMHDERLLAIVAALIIENRVDALNEAFIPKYNLLLGKNNDFTFSMKITLLESLDLVPRLYLRAAHCIRSIRNEFAHQLDKTTLSTVKEKYLNQLKAVADEAYGIFQNLERPSTLPLIAIFRKVLWFCITGLGLYKYNLKILREEFSKPEYVEGLQRLAAHRHMDRLNEILSQTPIEVVEQNGLRIETYAGGVKNIVAIPGPTAGQPTEGGEGDPCGQS